MTKHKRSLWMLLTVISIFGAILVSTLRSQSYESGVPKHQRDKDLTERLEDFKRKLPVTDFEGQEPGNEKGKKYNREMGVADPNLVTVSDRWEWAPNISSLPVEESDAVILGKVTNAEAHLSSDKTGIYSEFTVEILDILKNDNYRPLKVSGSVAVERAGGQVRFPSGHVTMMYVSNLGVPRVGERYVLFLTHNFPFQVRRDEDYRILTGYELLDGRVVPLDSGRLVEFESHRGKDESTFVAELKAAINK
jgi:hypothetical protein